MSATIEKYYRVRDVALLLDFCTKWVVERAKAGEFGRCFCLEGDDYRIPAAGVNAFIERNRVRPKEEIKPIAARTEGELRRKAKDSPDVCTT
jgi:hypothetical protein